MNQVITAPLSMGEREQRLSSISWSMAPSHSYRVKPSKNSDEYVNVLEE